MDIKRFSGLMRAAIFVVLAVSPSAGLATDRILKPEDLTRLGNTGPWIAQSAAGFEANPNLPVVDPAETGSEARLLRTLVEQGKSQGFGGILYDNRDRGHSILPRGLFPNLTFLRYDPRIAAQSMDIGLADRILIPNLVVGNSSTALTTGVAPRSLPRLAMTMPGGPALAARNYAINSIYIYPEHRDHDAIDEFPANWPYMIVSQGSSYSDRPFMAAVAMTLAAFSPETRAALLREGLMAPTVQMILRRNLTFVNSRDDYLSAPAHAMVLNGEWLRTGRMIGHAAAIRPDEIPPVVRLNVVQEDFSRLAGLDQRDEHLFTTPSAIARLWRGPQWQRDMIVSAESTVDPNGRDLRFQWTVLTGDPEKVSIEPLDPDGRRARIRLKWQDAFIVPVRGPSDVASRRMSRVDIGVIASNGVNDSAASVISVHFPTHQSRTYTAAPGGQMRLASVDYNAITRKVQFDPVLYWSAPWIDTYEYDAAGTLAGWVRNRGGQITRFDASGNIEGGSAVAYAIKDPSARQPTLGVTEAGN
jgi:hypothetical protein